VLANAGAESSVLDRNRRSRMAAQSHESQELPGGYRSHGDTAKAGTFCMMRSCNVIT